MASVPSPHTFGNPKKRPLKKLPMPLQAGQGSAGGFPEIWIAFPGAWNLCRETCGWGRWHNMGLARADMRHQSNVFRRGYAMA